MNMCADVTESLDEAALHRKLDTLNQLKARLLRATQQPSVGAGTGHSTARTTRIVGGGGAGAGQIDDPQMRYVARAEYEELQARLQRRFSARNDLVASRFKAKQ